MSTDFTGLKPIANHPGRGINQPERLVGSPTGPVRGTHILGVPGFSGSGKQWKT